MYYSLLTLSSLALSRIFARLSAAAAASVSNFSMADFRVSSASSFSAFARSKSISSGHSASSESRMVLWLVTSSKPSEVKAVLGYAYEICSRLIKYGFEELKLHKIVAETVDVSKSIPLMKKLGMKQEGVQKKHSKSNEGTWCDLHWFGILEEEYLSQV